MNNNSTVLTCNFNTTLVLLHGYAVQYISIVTAGISAIYLIYSYLEIYTLSHFQFQEIAHT